jgi:transposase-like protein
MGRVRRAGSPPCGHCGDADTTGHGSEHGRKRWLCHGCGRTFGATTGTPLWGLKTPAADVARALWVVLRRGSLRAAEEQTGHKYETIAKWLRRAGAHAEALTAALVEELDLAETEIDEFWSFVRKKGAPTAPQRRGVSVGAA